MIDCVPDENSGINQYLRILRNSVDDDGRSRALILETLYDAENSIGLSGPNLAI